MTSDDFRKMALELEGALESAHMGHPDFRTKGKIFATLQYPDEDWGMVKLPPEQQENFIRAHPNAFVPVKGAWGRKGCTNVRLKAVDEIALKEALRIAWSNTGKAKRSRPRKRVSGESRQRGR
jgi:hypothetical protein